MADGVIREVLERSIDELPDELRIVFVACVVDGMTPGQFAELFALTCTSIVLCASRGPSRCRKGSSRRG
jgi:DNA-directed RNA polymerase specialized sigma24 family protein